MNMLPTLEDIFMDYLWIRHDIKTETKTNKEPSVAEIAAILADKEPQYWQTKLARFGCDHRFPL